MASKVPESKTDFFFMQPSLQSKPNLNSNVSKPSGSKKCYTKARYEKPQIIDRGVLFMKRLEMGGASIIMKDADRDMIEVFTDEAQIKGVQDVEAAILEDDLELKVLAKLNQDHE